MRGLLFLLLSSCASTKPVAPPPPPTKTVARADKPALPPTKRELPELQKQSLETMVLAFNNHDAKALARLYTADAVVRSPSDHGFATEHGRDQLEKGHAALFAKSTDVKIATVRSIRTGNVVMWEWLVHGTLAGKPLDFAAGSVLTFDDEGLIKLDHTYFDTTVSKSTGSPSGAWIDAPADSKQTDIAKALFAAYENEDEKGFLAKLDDKTLHVDHTDPKDPVGGLGTNQKEFRAAFAGGKSVKVYVDSVTAAGDFVALETDTHTSFKGLMKKPIVVHRLEVLDIRFGKVMGWTSYGNSAEKSN
jgi:ketosteroid isomerase-like protein